MPQGKWRLLQQETLEQQEMVTIQKHDYELPNGSQIDGYIMLLEHDAVHIVAITDGHEVLLVRQYRPGVDGWMYELPAGFIEEGESDPLERAKRELREETGYESDSWYALGPVHPAVHRMRKTEHCYLALAARRAAGQELDQTEAVEIEQVGFAQLQQMIAGNQITSAGTLAALSKAVLLMERLGASQSV